MQQYLQTHLLSVPEKQFAFELRCRNFPVKANRKNQHEDDMRCRACSDENSIEDEEHIFFACPVLRNKDEDISGVKFDDIFGDLEKQINAIKFLKLKADKLRLILETRNISF